MMQIVAVGMLDVEAFGRDTFFVQTDAAHVRVYEVHKDGRVIPTPDQDLPLSHVAASIEKFGNGYRLEKPLALRELKDLVGLLGKFTPTSETSCTYRG